MDSSAVQNDDLNKFCSAVIKIVTDNLDLGSLSKDGQFDVDKTRQFFQGLAENAGNNSVEKRMSDRVGNMISMLADLSQMADPNADPEKKAKASKSFVAHCNAAFGGPGGQGQSQLVNDTFEFLQKNGKEIMQHPAMQFVMQMLGVNAGLERYSNVQAYRNDLTQTTNTINRFNKETLKYNIVSNNTSAELKKNGITPSSLQKTLALEEKNINAKEQKLKLIKSAQFQQEISKRRVQYERDLDAFMSGPGQLLNKSNELGKRSEDIRKGLESLKTDGFKKFKELDDEITKTKELISKNENLLNKTKKDKTRLKNLNREIKEGEKIFGEEKKKFDKELKAKGLFNDFYGKNENKDVLKDFPELLDRKESLDIARNALNDMKEEKSAMTNPSQKKLQLEKDKLKLLALTDERTKLSTGYGKLFSGQDPEMIFTPQALEEMGTKALGAAIGEKNKFDTENNILGLSNTMKGLQDKVNLYSEDTYKKKVGAFEAGLQKDIRINEQHKSLLNNCNQVFNRQNQLASVEGLLKNKCSNQLQNLPFGDLGDTLGTIVGNLGQMMSTDKGKAELSNLLNGFAEVAGDFVQMAGDLLKASKSLNGNNSTTASKVNALSQAKKSTQQLTNSAAKNGGDGKDKDDPLMYIAKFVLKLIVESLNGTDQMQNSKQFKNVMSFAQSENVFERSPNVNVFYNSLTANKKPVVNNNQIVQKPKVNTNIKIQPQVNSLQLGL